MEVFPIGGFFLLDAPTSPERALSNRRTDLILLDTESERLNAQVGSTDGTGLSPDNIFHVSLLWTQIFLFHALSFTIEREAGFPPAATATGVDRAEICNSRG